MVLDVAREQSAALGVAVMYEDFLRHVRGDAIEAVRGRDRGSRRGGRPKPRAGLPPHRMCSACESADRVATNYLRLLAGAEPDSEIGRAARRSGRGLCLFHLGTGLEIAGSLEGAERLLELYLIGEEEPRRDLAEFIRKNDYRFRSEGFSRREATSWQRAVDRLIGDPPPRRKPER